jgi:hypothetical protein
VCEGYSALVPRRYCKETLLRVQRLIESRGLKYGCVVNRPLQIWNFGPFCPYVPYLGFKNFHIGPNIEAYGSLLHCNRGLFEGFLRAHLIFLRRSSSPVDIQPPGKSELISGCNNSCRTVNHGR